MLTHTKVSSSMIAALLLLTLLPGAPFGWAQDRPVAAPLEPLNTLSNIAATKAHFSDFSTPSASSTVQMPGAPADAATRARVEAAFGQLPLYFVENQGRLDERVAYYIQAGDKTLYFTSRGVTFALTGGAPPADPSPALPYEERQKYGPGERAQRWIVKLDFIGANPDVRPTGEEKTDAIVSYFKGSPEEWHTGIPTYARILYRDLWPGIDLVFYGTVDQLKYDFIVHPGADPGQIRLAYRGAENVALNGAGQLEVTTAVGGFSDDVPLAYQDIDGQRVEVAAAYNLQSPIRHPPSAIRNSPFSFHIGPYDSTRPLVIDPAVLIYCGYIGGSGDDRGYDIAVDGAGAAYIVGDTLSSEAEGFPVLVGPDLTHNGDWDAFVAKVKADGTGLDYCGYIGGANWDYGNGIAVDGAGAAYIVGETESSELQGFPVIGGPDLIYNLWGDAFVAKVKADGTGLDYCGYIGGSSFDYGEGIAVDGAGAAYVVGRTESSEAGGFPVLVGPDLTHNDGPDAFVAKVKADGTGLDYCGYIGGSGGDWGTGIAVDGAGAAYVAGWTESSEAEGFPVLVGPDLTYNGDFYDTFVAKVKADGTGLDYCGYIGGSGDDQGYDIAVDGAGAAYVAGWTESSEAEGFPVLVGPDLTYNGGSWDAFVAKVKADGTGLDYCGYIGGSDRDTGRGIAVDGAGAAYIVGETISSEAEGFPVVGGPDLTHNGIWDAFVAQVIADGTGLDYCGYIGGLSFDYGEGIAVDGAGAAYVVGYAVSSEAQGFPIVGGPDLTFNGGGHDAFVAKVGDGPSFPNVLYLPLVLRN